MAKKTLHQQKQDLRLAKKMLQAKELLQQAAKYIAKGVESGVYAPTVGGNLFAERLYEQINRFAKAKAPRLADANDLLKRAGPYIAKGIEAGAYTATVGGDLFAERLLNHIYSYTNVRSASSSVDHATKKSPGQLDREIAQALSRGRRVGVKPSRSGRHSSMSDDEKIRTAIARFPATFGLRGFPGDVFRLSPTSSYIADNKRVMLYTQRKDGNKWLDFAKGTESELRGQVTS